MILITSPKELNSLISQGVVKYDGNYKICVNGLELPVQVESDSTIVKSTESDVEKILKAFPSTAEATKLLSAKGLICSRNLRTGRKDVILKRLKSLNTKYTCDQLVSIIKYEVDKRVRNSDSRRNELMYMQGCEAWLNNDANIDALFEEMNNDTKPKQQVIDDNFKF